MDDKKVLPQKIYQILRDEAQASPRMDVEFMLWFLYARSYEYRFMGNLGFGGKFWKDGKWRVTCYPEDETDAVRHVIHRVNARLQELQQSLDKP